VPPCSPMKQVSGPSPVWSLVSGPTRPTRIPRSMPCAPRRAASRGPPRGRAAGRTRRRRSGSPTGSPGHLGEEEVPELGVRRVERRARWRPPAGPGRRAGAPAAERPTGARSASPTRAGIPGVRVLDAVERGDVAPRERGQVAQEVRRVSRAPASASAAGRGQELLALADQQQVEEGATGSGFIWTAMPPATTSGCRSSRSAARSGRPAADRRARTCRSPPRRTARRPAPRNPAGPPRLHRPRLRPARSGRKARSQRRRGSR